MEFLDIFTNYWLEWLFGVIALGIGLGVKHYAKIQKRVWNIEFDEKIEKCIHEEIEELEGEILEVKEKSYANDREMKVELETVSTGVDNLTTGILSVQGKQFRDFCIYLLDSNHKITVQEYEQFEEDYIVYKNLGGNHRGDSLHDRVVKKFDEQTANG